jgi:hypothetical protein
VLKEFDSQEGGIVSTAVNNRWLGVWKLAEESMVSVD